MRPPIERVRAYLERELAATGDHPDGRYEALLGVLNELGLAEDAERSERRRLSAHACHLRLVPRRAA